MFAPIVAGLPANFTEFTRRLFFRTPALRHAPANMAEKREFLLNVGLLP